MAGFHFSSLLPDNLGIRRYRWRNTLLCALALVWMSPATWAWGREGHRISGLIANELLTPRSRIILRQKLGSDDLSLTATWADDYRAPLASLYPRSAQWHYDNIPLCSTTPRARTHCPTGDCASARIGYFQQQFRHPDTPGDQQADALRFIVHLLGDLQQPLHAADHDDRGGNEVKVQISGVRETVKLHQAWDTLLLRADLRGRSEAAYAAELSKTYRADIPAMQTGTLEDWVIESHHLARTVVYEGLGGPFHCGMNTAGKTFTLSAEYRARATPVIRLQLVRAGARIARLLNRLLDPATP